MPEITARLSTALAAATKSKATSAKAEWRMSTLADRYAIQKELGAGGMATVYLAEDIKHERKPHGE